MRTEKSEMSSSAWPRHPSSPSCRQRLPTPGLSPESRLLMPQGALQHWVWNDSLSPLQPWWPTTRWHHGHRWSTAPPLLLQHLYVHGHRQARTILLPTACSGSGYAALASHCSHYKMTPPTGSGGVALCQPTPRVTFSLLSISLLSLYANHPIKLFDCHMEILQATEESSAVNCPYTMPHSYIKQ